MDVVKCWGKILNAAGFCNTAGKSPIVLNSAIGQGIGGSRWREAGDSVHQIRSVFGHQMVGDRPDKISDDVVSGPAVSSSEHHSVISTVLGRHEPFRDAAEGEALSLGRHEPIRDAVSRYGADAENRVIAGLVVAYA